MRDPALNFQPRRPGLLTVVLLLAGLLLCADAWLEASTLRSQLDEVESKLAQAKRRADRIDVSRRDSRPENVFSADESSLLAIRPNAAGKSVQISGEARDMKAALAFVEALRREPLDNAALLSHQLKQNDPQRPIIFEISATWLTGS
jgi:hypothetical protein